MREHLGYAVKSVSDHKHKDLSTSEVREVFEENYLNKTSPLNVLEAHFIQKKGIYAVATFSQNGGPGEEWSAAGNGRLDAISNAIKAHTGYDFTLIEYSEHSLDSGSSSRAMSYVGLKWSNGTVTWGAGSDTDIITAGIKALVSAINNKK